MHRGKAEGDYLCITVVGTLRALLAAGAGSRMRLAPAGKVEDALLLAVVEEEVEGPYIPHLTCSKDPSLIMTP